jgi:hypothetical protein
VKHNYKREYKIPECKNIYPLPFDFAIFDDNNNLKLLIEFNGEQHYRPIQKFGGKKAFTQQVKRDKIKIDFCKSNNLNLLIIRFDEYDLIENILSTKLSKLKL